MIWQRRGPNPHINTTDLKAESKTQQVIGKKGPHLLTAGSLKFKQGSVLTCGHPGTGLKSCLRQGHSMAVVVREMSHPGPQLKPGQSRLLKTSLAPQVVSPAQDVHIWGPNFSLSVIKMFTTPGEGPGARPDLQAHLEYCCWAWYTCRKAKHNPSCNPCPYHSFYSCCGLINK